MNSDPLSQELACVTLRPQDASEQVVTALRNHADLHSRWQEEVQFDRSTARAYLAKPLPEDLEADLITRLAGVMQPKPRVAWRHVAWKLTAAAACLSILGWLAFLWSEAPSQGWHQQTLAYFDNFEDSRQHLGYVHPKLSALKKHLAKQGSPLANHIPDLLKTLTTYGCTQVTVGEHKACIVCFELPSGKEAHLAIIESELVSSPSPQLGHDSRWSYAVWQHQGFTYMVGTTAGMTELRQLLGMA